VLERVLDITGGRLLVDEFTGLQACEGSFQFIVGLVRHALDQPKRELAPEHSERLQQLLFLGRKSIKP
jgi:hypothetical protein